MDFKKIWEAAKWPISAIIILIVAEKLALSFLDPELALGTSLDKLWLIMSVTTISCLWILALSASAFYFGFKGTTKYRMDYIHVATGTLVLILLFTILFGFSESIPSGALTYVQSNSKFISDIYSQNTFFSFIKSVGVAMLISAIAGAAFGANVDKLNQFSINWPWNKLLMGGGAIIILSAILFVTFSIGIATFDASIIDTPISKFVMLLAGYVSIKKFHLNHMTLFIGIFLVTWLFTGPTTLDLISQLNKVPVKLYAVITAPFSVFVYSLWQTIIPALLGASIALIFPNLPPKSAPKLVKRSTKARKRKKSRR